MGFVAANAAVNHVESNYGGDRSHLRSDFCFTRNNVIPQTFLINNSKSRRTVYTRQKCVLKNSGNSCKLMLLSPLQKMIFLHYNVFSQVDRQKNSRYPDDFSRGQRIQLAGVY